VTVSGGTTVKGSVFVAACGVRGVLSVRLAEKLYTPTVVTLPLIVTGVPVVPLSASPGGTPEADQVYGEFPPDAVQLTEIAVPTTTSKGGTEQLRTSGGYTVPMNAKGVLCGDEPLSCTVMEKLYAPVPLAAPLTVIVVAVVLAASPAGSPEVEKEYGAVPPLAAQVVE
jgi:hypothetical protein